MPRKGGCASLSILFAGWQKYRSPASAAPPHRVSFRERALDAAPSDLVPLLFISNPLPCTRLLPAQPPPPPLPHLHLHSYSHFVECRDTYSTSQYHVYTHPNALRSSAGALWLGRKHSYKVTAYRYSTPTPRTRQSQWRTGRFHPRGIPCWRRTMHLLVSRLNSVRSVAAQKEQSNRTR